jgi:hypothetical protein
LADNTDHKQPSGPSAADQKEHAAAVEAKKSDAADPKFSAEPRMVQNGREGRPVFGPAIDDGK